MEQVLKWHTLNLEEHYTRSFTKLKSAQTVRYQCKCLQRELHWLVWLLLQEECKKPMQRTSREVEITRLLDARDAGLAWVSYIY
jgi:hypothetical protein